MNIPLIALRIDDRAAIHWPGETLTGEYQIDAVGPDDLRAVEFSVAWYTEGKGDEDLGIHLFQRFTAENTPDAALGEHRRFQVVLPNSPLSYEGVLVKIRWCIRVRVFTSQGRDYCYELPFQLGNVRPAQAVLETGGKEDAPPAVKAANGRFQLAAAVGVRPPSDE